jgi:hypothetical protein
MTVVRGKGFQIFKDRHGKWRCYHRRTGTPVDLKAAPLGSAEFFAECTRITALGVKTPEKPGTLGMLIAAYRAHPAFTDLAPRTRSDYQRVFDYLKPISDTPLVRFTKPLVVRIRDKAAAQHGRKFANDVKLAFPGSLRGVRNAASSARTSRPASRICGASAACRTPTDRGATRNAMRCLRPSRCT